LGRENFILGLFQRQGGISASLPRLTRGLSLVVRAGKTLKYTDTGVLGLAKGKKAILVLASGAVLTEDPWKS